jgi:hypothetical protein
VLVTQGGGGAGPGPTGEEDTMPDTPRVPDWAPTSQELAQVRNRQRQEARRIACIRLYDRGCLLEAPGSAATITSGNTGAKRGKIGGWSRASRKRMREFLLMYRPRPGWREYAVTLTVPGPPLEPEEKRRAFHAFTIATKRAGLGAVWRLEVQKRGAAHWHLLVVAGPGFRPHGDIPVDVAVALWTRQAWKGCLDLLGEASWALGRTGDVYTGSRGSAPGSDRHMIDVQAMGDKGAGWCRYMFDHTTKAKQEQEAGEGRHWGIINRAVFVEAPFQAGRLSDRAFARLHRLLRRWNRPRVRLPDRLFPVKDLKDPWQTKLGYAPKRGIRGASVWFAEGVLSRMVEHAKRGE